MESYELTLILPTEFTEAKQKDLLEKVKKTVEEAGGKVERQDKWGRRNLAYPIKRNEEGVYFFLKLSLSPDKVNPLNRLIETNEQVLRHLMVRS